MSTRKGWIDIDDLLAKYERDPAKAEQLRQARKELAPLLYPDGGEHYERMMRGDSPRARGVK